MSDSQKEVIKAQFLEEAQDYLQVLESGLLGISKNSLDPQQVDNMLRSAHSLKGGAALMEYFQLSEYAHRLEDFFKILKIGKVAPNDRIETLLLTSVDGLGELVNSYSQLKEVNQENTNNKIESIIEQLHQLLGDFNPEDEEALLAQNAQMDDNDMSAFLFETEVEEGLTRLEEAFEQQSDGFDDDFANFLVELSGLAQMIDLSPVSQLCESIELALQQQIEPKQTIISSALNQLRRSQALVLAKQPQLLSNTLRIETDAVQSPIIENTEPMIEIEIPDSLDTSITAEEEKFRLTDADLQTIYPDVEELADIESEIEEYASSITSSSSFVSLEQQALDPSLREFADNIANFAETTGVSTPEEIESLSVGEQVTSQQQSVTIRVDAKKISELEVLFSELNIDRNGLEAQLKNFRTLLDNLRYKLNDLEKNNFQLRTLYDQVATPSLKLATTSGVNSPSIGSDNSSNPLGQMGSFDSLEMDQYNDFHLVAGEMMENIVQLQELRNDLDIHLTDAEKIKRNLKNNSKLMQKNLTEISMRPFSDLLKKFPRALRQMEIEYGKKVNFQIKGGKTLLEKTILDQLNDPLLHLFRNAFDHGIEIPEIRTRKGKSPEGIIEIAASYRGNNTVITIRDDGKGIDLNKIIAKVKGMGLDDSDLAQISEKELLEIIFEPGFSTTAQVTDLSGRGVGMDVVKRNIEDIGGTVTVDTKLGVGTIFTLTVPFTMSLVRVLLVEVNNMLLAFPSNLISEVEIFDDRYVEKSGDTEYLSWEDEEIRLIDLADYFKFNYLPASSQLDDIPIINQKSILLVEKGRDLVGLKIDRYWNEQEVTVRKVEEYLPLPQGFSSCTVLGNGQIVPLVDTTQLLSAIEMQDASIRDIEIYDIEPDYVAQQRTQKTIMIVDDSINVRRFLALTLEKENYLVEQAKDGQEGLEKLTSGVIVDAVICDVEMPRLDGFGFLANVKTDPELESIPVMMLTSRSGDKHRRMASNLGANAYFSKPFQEQELLATIDSLITISDSSNPDHSYGKYVQINK